MNATINIKCTELIHVLPLIMFLNITFLFYAKQMDDTCINCPKREFWCGSFMAYKLLPAPRLYYSYSFFWVKFYKITEKELRNYRKENFLTSTWLLISVKKSPLPMNEITLLSTTHEYISCITNNIILHLMHAVQHKQPNIIANNFVYNVFCYFVRTLSTAFVIN